MLRKTDRPVTQRKTLAEVAYERIKDDIISGAFGPGESISPVKIANRLQISPMPVRGALARLEAERWVEILPQRGVFVSKITVEELQEIFVVRSRLEGLSANLACAHVGEAALAVLRRLLGELREFAEKNSRRYFRANTEFHETIIKCSQNETLIRLTMELRHRGVRIRALTHHVPGHMARRESEHERIVEALAARNGELAESAMREHTLAAGAELVEYLLKVSAREGRDHQDDPHTGRGVRKAEEIGPGRVGIPRD